MTILRHKSRDTRFIGDTRLFEYIHLADLMTSFANTALLMEEPCYKSVC